jgi:hypothetical protein
MPTGVQCLALLHSGIRLLSNNIPRAVSRRMRNGSASPEGVLIGLAANRLTHRTRSRVIHARWRRRASTVSPSNLDARRGRDPLLLAAPQAGPAVRYWKRSSVVIRGAGDGSHPLRPELLAG